MPRTVSCTNDQNMAAEIEAQLSTAKNVTHPIDWRISVSRLEDEAAAAAAALEPVGMQCITSPTSEKTAP